MNNILDFMAAHQAKHHSDILVDAYDLGELSAKLARLGATQTDLESSMQACLEHLKQLTEGR